MESIRPEREPQRAKATESAQGLLDPWGDTPDEITAAHVLGFTEDSAADVSAESLLDDPVAPNRTTSATSTTTAEIDSFDELFEDSSATSTELIPADEAERGLAPAATPPVVVRPRRMADRRRRRRYGVAPFARPATRRNRRKRKRDYRKAGFIELTQEKQKRRHRILPRTVIGISLTLFAMGLGAAFAGAYLYAHYQYRLQENEQLIAGMTGNLEEGTAGATAQMQEVAQDSIDQINSAIDPIQGYLAETNAVVDLPANVANSVWLVRTQDAAGVNTLGSAFVVASDASGSLLLTSLDVVRAATAQPGPAVIIENQGQQLPATVWAWDEEHDMALLTVERSGLPQLEWAPNEVNSTAIGRRVYAISGFGANGASASPGIVLDQNQSGMVHNASVNGSFRGGPLLTAESHVMGVVSLDYSPLGFEGGDIPFAPHIVAACVRVIRCSDDMWSSGGPLAPGYEEPADDTLTETEAETSTDESGG